MRKGLIIILLFAPVLVSARTVMFDDFTNSSQITFRSNVFLTNSQAMVSNVVNQAKGVFFATNVQKAGTEQWQFLKLNYFITNFTSPPPVPYIKVSLLDQNKVFLDSRTFYNTSSQQLDLTTIPNLNIYSNIVLEFLFFCGQGIIGNNVATPRLNSYEVTVLPAVTNSMVYPPKNTSIAFYAAPAPLRIENNNLTRFYYKFTKACKADLKIYDTNYNLIINVLENQVYAAGSSLNATWDGKNGAGLKVISGVYIAILEVRNNDSTKENPDPFPFAVIR